MTYIKFVLCVSFILESIGGERDVGLANQRARVERDRFSDVPAAIANKKRSVSFPFFYYSSSCLLSHSRVCILFLTVFL
jgi:hypothetical protein